MFLDSGSAALSEMGTEQFEQVLFSSLDVHLNAEKGAKIAQYFIMIMIFRDRGVGIILLKSDQNLRLVIETNQ